MYLGPPENAVVLCVDEKSPSPTQRVEASDRTAPVLPILPGVPEKQFHDYVRNGKTTLFAALEVATGKITQTCQPRHRHQEFLRFLKTGREGPTPVASCTSSATTTPPTSRREGLVGPPLPDHPALHPDLGVLDEPGRDLLRDHHPAGYPPRHVRLGRELIEDITRFIDGWNERCQPFIWTTDADTIIAKPHRKLTSGTPH